MEDREKVQLEHSKKQQDNEPSSSSKLSTFFLRNKRHGNFKVLLTSFQSTDKFWSFLQTTYTQKIWCGPGWQVTLPWHSGIILWLSQQVSWWHSSTFLRDIQGSPTTVVGTGAAPFVAPSWAPAGKENLLDSPRPSLEHHHTIFLCREAKIVEKRRTPTL